MRVVRSLRHDVPGPVHRSFDIPLLWSLPWSAPFQSVKVVGHVPASPPILPEREELDAFAIRQIQGTLLLPSASISKGGQEMRRSSLFGRIRSTLARDDFLSGGNVMSKKLIVAMFFVAGLVAPVCSLSTADASEVVMARDGQALLPVVVSEEAGEKVQEAARTLADYLGRISGGTFEVTEGDGTQGIAVGLFDDFPDVGVVELFDSQDPTRSEDYLLRSHAGGVLVVGATENAVRHAVWGLLYRQGHRQFFPSETWEVVPRSATLTVDVDEHVRPSYPWASMFHSMATFRDDQNREIFRWMECNGMHNSRDWSFGHVYQELLREYPEVFEQHPEYLALTDGKRSGSKFCISNSGIRELFVQRSLKWLKEHPEAVVVSAEPSDGGGWCECDACARLGSPSDQAVILANQVAEAVESAYPDTTKYVGLLSYSFHSPPPEMVKTHPRLLIGFTQGFFHGELIGMDLVDAWIERDVKQFGIYDYFNVYQWSHDMPGKPGVASLRQTARKIRDFHARGAVHWMGEATNSWGSAGLGMYIAARTLREVDLEVDDLVDDFLTRAFGDAKVPMQTFYDLIAGDTAPLVCDDLVGRMYQTLDEARQQTSDPKVRARIRDLILWTHYVELFRRYTADTSEGRQTKFERMVRYAYRIDRTHMVASRAVYYYHDHGLDPKVTIPDQAAFLRTEEEGNPWKETKPFSPEEIDMIVAEGIARHPTNDIEPITFSENLVPATPLGLKQAPRNWIRMTGGGRTLYTWVDEGQEMVRLRARGGCIEGYRDRGPAKVRLFWPADSRTTIANAQFPPTGEWTDVALPTAHQGLHRIEFQDRGYHEVDPETGRLAVDKWSRTVHPNSPLGSFEGHFFVPTGTEYVGGYATDGYSGQIWDGDGNVVFTFGGGPPRYFKIPVLAGQDGNAWKFDGVGGTPFLMTVPPYIARSPDELLIPEEVLKAELRLRRTTADGAKEKD